MSPADLGWHWTNICSFSWTKISPFITFLLAPSLIGHQWMRTQKCVDNSTPPIRPKKINPFIHSPNSNYVGTLNTSEATSVKLSKESKHEYTYEYIRHSRHSPLIWPLDQPYHLHPPVPICLSVGLSVGLSVSFSHILPQLNHPYISSHINTKKKKENNPIFPPSQPSSLLHSIPFHPIHFACHSSYFCLPSRFISVGR